MIPYPTNPVAVVLADGVERHLRYPLSVVKIIKEKYASMPPLPDPTATAETRGLALQAKIVGHLGTSPEESLPYFLMQGLIEKEGLTEQVIAETMIDGPMVEYVVLCVIESFFGPRLARQLRDKMRVEAAVMTAAIEGTLKALTKPDEKKETSMEIPSILQ